MNHIHELFGIDKPYVDICREERNFAAMLYHLLLDKDRLKAFLELVGDSTSSIDDVRIYFEYAHLRDLWAAVAAEAKRERKTANLNDRYRKIILRLFCGSTESNQLPTDCKEFNEFFIGKGAKASAQQIQSPSRWQKSQFDTWCKEPFDRKFAERACMLNWAFKRQARSGSTPGRQPGHLHRSKAGIENRRVFDQARPFRSILHETDGDPEIHN